VKRINERFLRTEDGISGAKITEESDIAKQCLISSTLLQFKTTTTTTN
jgi:hypothetical protein